MASNEAIRLISALRKARSRAALYDTPERFFEAGEERDAFLWLRNYVNTYSTWPSPLVMQRELGITTVTTTEPLAYYQGSSRKKALWSASVEPYGDLREAMKSRDPDKAVEAARRIVAMSSELSATRQGLITLSEGAALVNADYDEAKRTIGLRGIPTGHVFVDEATDGLQNANLYSTVARPGRGKTYRLLLLAQAARAAGYSVLFLSMEMGVLQVSRRFAGLHTGINPKFIRTGRLSTQVEREMKRQLDELEDDGPPFYWLAGNFKKTVPALKAAAYETGADLIIADASYLLKPEDRTAKNSRHEVINDVMEGLADISTSVNRPVYQSIQFNRLATKPKRGDDEQDRRNPLAHLDLTKIGGSDTIGQISAYVDGIELGDAPHEQDERYSGILKGREGEFGWYKWHYKFQPVNFSQIMDHTQMADYGAIGSNGGPNLGFMDAEL